MSEEAKTPELIDPATGEVVPEVPENTLVVRDPDKDALDTFGREFGLARAEAIAKDLCQLIEKRDLSVRIGNKDHILVEAWCALAAMCGLTPHTEWTREITEKDKDGVEKNYGYLARVEIKRIANGETVGAAECSCERDENLWKGRDRHALRSMAQTRATSKALGQALRWIVEMANFSGTPAEEMPGFDPSAPQPSEPRPSGTAMGKEKTSDQQYFDKKSLAIGIDRLRHFQIIPEDRSYKPSNDEWRMARAVRKAAWAHLGSPNPVEKHHYEPIFAAMDRTTYNEETGEFSVDEGTPTPEDAADGAMEDLFN